MRPIYICLATDDNYVQLASVAIASLIESQDMAQIELFILDSGISYINKKKLFDQCKGHITVQFIDVKSDLEKLVNLGVNTQGTFNSYAAYSRFYIVNYLPDYVDKLLYIDCDTCVTSSLQDLFNIDMKQNWLGAVIDILPDFHKLEIGFDQKDYYFNSGVLLFNINLWRENKIVEQIENHLMTHKSKYSFHDQDIINIVCKDKILPLHPKYMVFYPEYTWGLDGIMILSDLNKNSYYSAEEILSAANEPCIIHYVECVYGRPWYIGCRYKYFSYWYDALKKSPYALDFKYQEKKSSIKHKIFECASNFLPRNIFIFIHKIRKNKILHRKEEKIK